MTILQTNVDKLISLVDEKKRISVRDATKKLNVSKSLIDDWANFLEEEGLITREYKLTNEFLILKGTSKKELGKREKEVSLKKDIMIKKAEDLLSKTTVKEKEFSGLKEEFVELKRYLGKNIDKVHKALNEIEEYNKLKRNSEKAVEKERQEYETRIKVIDNMLTSEEKKYNDVLNKIKEKNENLKEKGKEVGELRSDEDELIKRLNKIKEAADETRKKISYDDKKRMVIEEEVKGLKNIADKISTELTARKNRMDNLVKESRKREEQAARKQEILIKKMSLAFKEGEEIKINFSEKLRNFFKKKKKIEELLKKGEKEEDEVKKELIQFIRKLKTLNYLKKTPNKNISEIEKKYAHIEEKKGLFEKYQDELKKTLNSLEKK